MTAAVPDRTETTLLAAERGAQERWAQTSVRERLRTVTRFRHLVVERCREIADAVDRERSETLVSEVLPFVEACRFLEREAESILAPRRLGSEGRPVWLGGVELEVRREPLGIVLVIGPFNYPLFLPGVQALQALTAGNAVIVKPGRGGQRVMDMTAECLRDAGLDPRLLRVTSESPAEADPIIEAGADKVFVTGSSATGLAVMSQLARHGTPSVMELSGDDAVFVRPSADLTLVARAIRFGQQFNAGQTCIAPKRVFVRPSMAERVRTLTDLPVVAAEDEEAVRLASASGYALGASVFGETEEAIRFAGRLRAGVVVINDMIVPTADPRVPFGGRGRSGFGVTRGPEGLLEMTAIKTIAVRRSRWLPHFEPRSAQDDELFASFLQVLHAGSLSARLRAAVRAGRLGMRRRQSL